MFDVCVIGPVARDLNTIGGREQAPQPGGAAYYATMVYAQLGLRAAVVTRVAPADERRLLTELQSLGVEVFNLPTDITTTFRNIYAPENPDVRMQRVDAVAETIGADALPPIRTRIWQLGPLTNRDMAPELIGHCASRDGMVAIDVQGLTRAILHGRVVPGDPRACFDQLRHVRVMKADVEEILIYAAADDLDQAVAQVQQAGTAEVLITRASQGSTVYGPGGRIEVPAVPPRPLVDATGCGDTYLAAYLARRLESDDLADCGAFAAAAATIKMEASGPFRGNAEEIAQRRGALQAG